MSVGVRDLRGATALPSVRHHGWRVGGVAHARSRQVVPADVLEGDQHARGSCTLRTTALRCRRLTAGPSRSKGGNRCPRRMTSFHSPVTAKRHVSRAVCRNAPRAAWAFAVETRGTGRGRRDRGGPPQGGWEVLEPLGPPQAAGTSFEEWGAGVAEFMSLATCMVV